MKFFLFFYDFAKLEVDNKLNINIIIKKTHNLGKIKDYFLANH